VFDEMTKRLQLNGDLRIIDGQHRTEGLRYAIEEKGHIPSANMQVPVVIMEVADRAEELNQFRIINGTAKSVRTDLVNSIITALAEHEGEDTVLAKDRWKVIITKVVSIMDRTPGSPWEDILLMPDMVGKDFPDKIARSTSVMTSIRPIYNWLEALGILNDRAGTGFDQQAEYMADIIIEYWRALKAVVPEAFAAPDDYVIQKTPGLFALHLVLGKQLLGRMYQGRRDFDQKTFEEFLGVSPEITDSDFWDKTKGRASSYGSMKGFTELSNFLMESLNPD
jgi:DGQHR domain-containing protein